MTKTELIDQLKALDAHITELETLLAHFWEQENYVQWGELTTDIMELQSRRTALEYALRARFEK